MLASPFSCLPSTCLPGPSEAEPLPRFDRRTTQPSLPLHALGALRSLPQAAFGYQWLMFWERQQHLAHKGLGQSRHSWLDCPYQASLHVLTGYGSDDIGLAELYAFLLGSGISILSVGLYLNQLCALSRGFVSSPDLFERRDVWARLHQAYCRGCYSWFELKYWQPQALTDLPLDYVRRWFRIIA